MYVQSVTAWIKSGRGGSEQLQLPAGQTVHDRRLGLGGSVMAEVQQRAAPFEQGGSDEPRAVAIGGVFLGAHHTDARFRACDEVLNGVAEGRGGGDFFVVRTTVRAKQRGILGMPPR